VTQLQAAHTPVDINVLQDYTPITPPQIPDSRPRYYHVTHLSVTQPVQALL